MTKEEIEELQEKLLDAEDCPPDFNVVFIEKFLEFFA